MERSEFSAQTKQTPSHTPKSSQINVHQSWFKLIEANRSTRLESNRQFPAYNLAHDNGNKIRDYITNHQR